DGNLAADAFILPARAERGHSFHAPDQAVGVPNSGDSSIGGPAGGMRTAGPQNHAPAVSVSDEIGPNRVVQRIRKIMFENRDDGITASVGVVSTWQRRRETRATISRRDAGPVSGLFGHSIGRELNSIDRISGRAIGGPAQ